MLVMNLCEYYGESVMWTQNRFMQGKMTLVREVNTPDIQRS